MNLYNLYATNATQEEEGKDFPLAGNLFKIARSGNKTYNRLMVSLYETHKFTLDKKGPEADACGDQIIIEIMSKSILLGWRDPIVWKDGELLEYSSANAAKILALKEFRKDINRLAENFQNFLAVTEAIDEKNLPTTLTGTLPGAPT